MTIIKGAWNWNYFGDSSGRFIVSEVFNNTLFHYKHILRKAFSLYIISVYYENIKGMQTP